MTLLPPLFALSFVQQLRVLLGMGESALSSGTGYMIFWQKRCLED
jgi:hypothetical protein